MRGFWFGSRLGIARTQLEGGRGGERLSWLGSGLRIARIQRKRKGGGSDEDLQSDKVFKVGPLERLAECRVLNDEASEVWTGRSHGGEPSGKARSRDRSLPKIAGAARFDSVAGPPSEPNPASPRRAPSAMGRYDGIQRHRGYSGIQRDVMNIMRYRGIPREATGVRCMRDIRGTVQLDVGGILQNSISEGRAGGSLLAAARGSAGSAGRQCACSTLDSASTGGSPGSAESPRRLEGESGRGLQIDQDASRRHLQEPTGQPAWPRVPDASTRGRGGSGESAHCVWVCG